MDQVEQYVALPSPGPSGKRRPGALPIPPKSPRRYGSPGGVSSPNAPQSSGFYTPTYNPESLTPLTTPVKHDLTAENPPVQQTPHAQHDELNSRTEGVLTCASTTSNSPVRPARRNRNGTPSPSQRQEPQVSVLPFLHPRSVAHKTSASSLSRPILDVSADDSAEMSGEASTDYESAAGDAAPNNASVAHVETSAAGDDLANESSADESMARAYTSYMQKQFHPPQLSLSIPDRSPLQGPKDPFFPGESSDSSSGTDSRHSPHASTSATPYSPSKSPTLSSTPRSNAMRPNTSRTQYTSAIMPPRSPKSGTTPSTPGTSRQRKKSASRVTTPGTPARSRTPRGKHAQSTLQLSPHSQKTLIFEQAPTDQLSASERDAGMESSDLEAASFRLSSSPSIHSQQLRWTTSTSPRPTSRSSITHPSQLAAPRMLIRGSNHSSSLDLTGSQSGSRSSSRSTERRSSGRDLYPGSAIQAATVSPSISVLASPTSDSAVDTGEDLDADVAMSIQSDRSRRSSLIRSRHVKRSSDGSATWQVNASGGMVRRRNRRGSGCLSRPMSESESATEPEHSAALQPGLRLDSMIADVDEDVLQDQFLAAIEVRRASESATAEGSGFRLSIPSTARTNQTHVSNIPFPDSPRLSTAMSSVSTCSSISLNDSATDTGGDGIVAKGSKTVSSSTFASQDVGIPVVSAAPLSRLLIAQDHGHAGSVISLPHLDNNDANNPLPAAESRRAAKALYRASLDLGRRVSRSSAGMLYSRQLGSEDTQQCNSRSLHIDSDSATPRPSVLASEAQTELPIAQRLSTMVEHSDMSALHTYRLGAGPMATVTEDGVRTPDVERDLQEELIGPYDQQRMRQRSLTTISSRSIDYDASLPPTPFADSVASFDISIAGQTQEVERDTSDMRQRVVDELVETERLFALDMALTRDIWLARARGTQIAEILTSLQRREIDIPSSPHPSIETIASSIAPSPSASQMSFPRTGDTAEATSSQRLTKNPSSASLRSSLGANRPSGPSGAIVQDRSPSLSGRSGFARALPRLSGSHKRQGSASSSFGTSLNSSLSGADIRVLFNNLEDIADFSRTFLRELQACQAITASSSAVLGTNAASIGEAFLRNAGQMETVYSLYCSHFGDAISRFEQLEPNLMQYTSECKELAAGRTNAWDLPSLLIKPVQRCLKYPLLLQNLMAYTSRSDQEYSCLKDANSRMLAIAETINELKRRQEVIGKLFKSRVRSDGHVRKGSVMSLAKSRSVSNGSQSAVSDQPKISLVSSMSKRFRNSGKLSVKTSSPATNDGFSVLVGNFESRFKQIQKFQAEIRDYVASHRSVLKALFNMTTTWSQIYIPHAADDPDIRRSGRTVEYFANNVAKYCLDGPLRDVDRQIRTVISPKIDALLACFDGPRRVISRRHVKLVECFQDNLGYQGAREASAGRQEFDALNAQLFAEIPKFLKLVGQALAGILGRFATLQVAFYGKMAEIWRDYVVRCCTQLGPPNLPAQAIVPEWWRLVQPIVIQLDNLGILNSVRTMREVQKHFTTTLPSSLQKRRSITDMPLFSSVSPRASYSEQSQPRVLYRKSSDRNAQQHQASPRRPSSQVVSAAETDSATRSSTLSAQSNNSSLGHTACTSPSINSPFTPPSGSPVIWQGACIASYQPSLTYPDSSGISHMPCQIGDLLEILEESHTHDQALVRKEGSPHVGWIPLHILARLE